MTAITLHNYLQQIEKFTAENRFEEAITHCRHILEKYPRHVETYRTLARALLEKGEYHHAIDLLHRILSTDPNDFLAHVGLSMAYKEEDMFDESIWHLERALELKPYNVALQEELQAIYARDGGKPVPLTTSLSRGALARIYLEGAMYPAAIAELRRALGKNEARIDLQVLLAEAYWRANQRVEAVALCLEILDKLPNCIQANAILAEIWLETGRVAEAQTYLKRLQDLVQLDQAHCDGETAVCRAFLAPGAPPLPEEVTVELLPDGTEPVSIESSGFDWVSEFSKVEDTAPASEEDTFAWLNEAELTGPSTLDETPADTVPDETAASSVEAESDWFVDPGASEADTLSDLLGEPAESAEVADWLEALDGVSLEKEGEAEEVSGDVVAALEEAGLTDLFTDWEQDETVAETMETAEEPFAENLTDLFAELNIEDELDAAEIGEEEAAAVEPAALTGESPSGEQPVDDEEHTGFTNLFDDLSTEPFPSDDTSELEPPETGDAVSLEAQGPVLEDVPDWLLETEDTDFEPIQIDNRLTTGWLTELDDSPDKSEGTAEPQAEEALPADDSQAALFADEDFSAADEPDEEKGKVPTWLLGGDQAPREFETPPPLDSMDGLTFDSEGLERLDELTKDAAVPTWLLGGDLAAEETGEFTAAPPEDEAESPKPELTLEDDLAALAGTNLPDWLLDDEPEATAVDHRPETELLGDDDKDASDWLAQDDFNGGEELEESVIGESDERDMEPQEEPEKDTSQAAEGDDETTVWPEPLQSQQDELPERPLSPEEESASFASKIAAGEGSAIDELPTQTIVPDELPKAGPFTDDLEWLDELSQAGIETAEEQVTLDWSREQRDIEDVLAGVTGELKDDLEWLDSLEEESHEEPVQEVEPADSLEAQTEDEALGWLDELAEAGEEMAPSGGEPVGNLDSLVETLEEEPDSDHVAPELTLPELDETMSELPDEVEGGPDWLAELETDEFGMQEVDLAGEAKAEADFAADLEPESPADTSDEIGEPMEWLEELAAEQGVALDELTGISEEAEQAEELDEELVVDTPEDAADAIDWLEELAASQDTPLEELPSIARVIDETPTVEPETEREPAPETLEIETEAEPTRPGLDREPEPETVEPAIMTDQQSEELEEALDWLEQLAWAEGTSLDEVDLTAETGRLEAQNELEEALDWLEQLAQTSVTAAPSEAAVAVPSDGDELLDLTDEMPDDPDEALAWLQQLATDQTEIAGETITEIPVEGAVVEPTTELIEAEPEEPAVVDELDDGVPEIEPESALVIDLPGDEGEVDVLAEMPEDPDAAMAWLEQLAARQGAPAEELPSITAVDQPDETAGPESETAVEAVFDQPDEAAGPEGETAVEATDDLASMLAEAASESDESVSWIDELVDEEEEPLAEIGVLASPAEVEEETEPAESEIEEEASVDLDDAMAWLEELAAQQGASLEELPTLSDKSAVEMDVPEIETADLPPAAGLEMEAETLAEPVDETAVEAPSLDKELAAEPDELPEDIPEAMPEWLGLETEPEDEPGETEWLQSLGEPDITGWLEEEEEATISGFSERTQISRVSSPGEASFEAGPLPPEESIPADTGPLVLPEDELITSVLDLDEEQLTAARNAMKADDIDKALAAYQELVDAGGGIMTLIADLETAAEEAPGQPMIRHLLGDAYMRNGQLQKALDTYRQALDQL